MNPIDSILLEYNCKAGGFGAYVPINIQNQGQAEGILIFHEIFPETVGNFDFSYSIHSEKKRITPKVIHIKPESVETIYIHFVINHPLDMIVIDEVYYQISIWITYNKTALAKSNSKLGFFQRHFKIVKGSFQFPLSLVITNYEFSKAITYLG